VLGVAFRDDEVVELVGVALVIGGTVLASRATSTGRVRTTP
jgi:hypothetical protein